VINRIGLINFWYYDEEEFNLNPYLHSVARCIIISSFK